MPLMVIESPNKVSSLQKYSKMKVIATKGHFRDLPSRGLGIDLDNDFEMTFEYNPGSQAFVRQLRTLAKNNDVYIATDPDREGYAIGRFVYEEIASIAKSVKRLEIHEITQRGVQKAMQSAIDYEDSNFGTFDAFLGRRGGDRLVGFLMSNLANREVLKDSKLNLSVGRVQSSALRLVADREAEIVSFKPEDRHHVTVRLGDEKFTAKHQKSPFLKKDEADSVLKNAKTTKTATVQRVTEKETTQGSRAPFTTVDLQASASAQLGLSPTQTMRLAQALFEKGLITYIRTDSVRISGGFVSQLRNQIKSDFGAGFVPEKPIFRRSKNSQADAHEAIRPTRAHSAADCAKRVYGAKLTAAHLKLYTLICKRTLASQMSPAVYDSVSAEFSLGKETYTASGRRLKFPGFLKAWNDSQEEKRIANEEDDENTLLPSLVVGQKLSVSSPKLKTTQTQPPSRFTEAALVKELEKLGIGRPSTYASVCSTLTKKQYVELVKRQLSPTDIGKKLVGYLKSSHPWVVDYDLTKKIEDQLDLIETDGSVTWVDVLSELHEKTGRLNPTDKATLPVSVNQVKYAKSLQEQTGLEIPEGALEDSSKISAYIKEAKGIQQAEYQKKRDATPLTEKQLAIIAEHGTTRVKNSVERGDYGAGRRWLDRYFKKLQKENPNFGKKPAYKKKTWKKRSR